MTIKLLRIGFAIMTISFIVAAYVMMTTPPASSIIPAICGVLIVCGGVIAIYGVKSDRA